MPHILPSSRARRSPLKIPRFHHLVPRTPFGCRRVMTPLIAVWPAAELALVEAELWRQLENGEIDLLCGDGDHDGIPEAVRKGAR
jgi:hypothetical protein